MTAHSQSLKCSAPARRGLAFKIRVPTTFECLLSTTNCGFGYDGRRKVATMMITISGEPKKNKKNHPDKYKNKFT